MSDQFLHTEKMMISTVMMISTSWMVLVSKMLQLPYQTAAQNVLYASLGQCSEGGREEICVSQSVLEKLEKLMAFQCRESNVEDPVGLLQCEDQVTWIFLQNQGRSPS